MDRIDRDPSTDDDQAVTDRKNDFVHGLLGDYKRGEERVLILAIRRETGLELTDGEIRDVLIEAVNDNTTAMSVLERLLMQETVDEEEFTATKAR